jgi:hypothetical protein
MVFIGEIHEFLQICQIHLLGENRASLHLEKPSCRKYSFHKLPPFSQGNNMLYTAASNIDGLLGEIHVFLPLSQTPPET